MSEVITPPSPASDEALRVLQVCNACRYCEGLCATFKSMTERREFATTDLDHLANVCHNCSACFYDCQYAPPHEFAINVPVALTELRLETYQRYAWPAGLARVLARHGVLAVCLMGTGLAAVLLAAVALSGNSLLVSHTGPGAFYQVMGHGVMVAVALATFGFSLCAMLVSGLRYWRAIRTQPPTWQAWRRGLGAALSLENLAGGHGLGCEVAEQQPSQLRRTFHHFTMWGFLLCFAATLVATWYHYALGEVAPYAFTSWPVVLGTLGGLGLIVGPLGLLWVKTRMDPQVLSGAQVSMDNGLLVSLLFISITGLLLLVLRDTPAMAVLLLIHLGFVFALFITLPYGKFVHGLYRVLALVEVHKVVSYKTREGQYREKL